MKILKRKYFINCIICLLIFSTCGQVIRQSDYITINLSNRPSMSPVKASTLLEDFRYIPLETTSESLIGHIRSSTTVIKDGFFVLDHLAQLNYFNAEGRFIRRIGSRGQGPGEFLNIVSFDVDEQKRLLYIYDMGRIFIYTFDNEFVRSIKVNAIGVLGKLMKTSWGYIAYNDPLQNLGKKTSVLITIDEEGNELNVLQTRKVDIQRSVFFNEPILKNFNGKYYYYPPYQDTIYSVHVDKIIPEYVLPKGRLSIAIEDMETLEKRSAAFAKGINLETFILDDHKLILFCTRQKKYELYFYDFASKKLSGISEIVNDLDNSGNIDSYRWNWGIYQNQLVEFIPAYMLKENKELPVTLKNLQEEDNPVIRISTLKSYQ